MKTLKLHQSKINIPENVSIEQKQHFLIFSGPLGSSQINIQKIDKKGFCAFQVNQIEKTITLVSSHLHFFKTLEILIKNKIDGVSRGFLAYLRIVGIGYRAVFDKNTLILKVGYSHDVRYQIPSSIRAFLIDNTLICLFGLDKNQITQIAAKIRQIKPPSPYKGKGIRLVDEVIRIKQGKQK